MRIEFICPRCGHWWTKNIPEKYISDPSSCPICGKLIVGRDESSRIKKN